MPRSIYIYRHAHDLHKYAACCHRWLPPSAADASLQCLTMPPSRRFTCWRPWVRQKTKRGSCSKSSNNHLLVNDVDSRDSPGGLGSSPATLWVEPGTCWVTATAWDPSPASVAHDSLCSGSGVKLELERCRRVSSTGTAHAVGDSGSRLLRGDGGV